MKHYKVIGLMSGTSLDGLDICYCEFFYNDQWNYKILNSKTVDYGDEWKDRLRNCMSLNKSDLAKLDTELGVFWGKEVAHFINENGLKVDFIASHGHTVFHQPDKGITLQIGDAQKIAEHTNQKVVYDFRTKDVELGGQGAPLVPIGDKLLFSNYNYCLNLGGISNISFDDQNGERRAFDISPCNLVLNYYAQQLGKEYDIEGSMARSGTMNENLFNTLNSIKYYEKSAPKSLGKEDITRDFLPVIENFDITVEDKLRTFSEHIGSQIGKELKMGSTLVSGGGAFNTYLMECITKNAKSKIVIANKTIISFKEALIFAFLGVLRVRNETNVLKSYTGARKDSISGVITNYS